MKVWINGRLVDESEAAVSVFDHGLLYGDGVFEGIRVYDGTAFRCQAHLDRLYASAEAIHLEVPIPRRKLTDALYETVRANGVRDGYVRAVVTRGPGTLGLNPYRCSGGTVFIIADQIALYSPEKYRDGLEVIVARHRRMSASMIPPSVKSLNYLNNILARMEAADAGVQEALMLNAAGELAEASGDNVFLVRDGTAITPPPAAGILIGITRKVVMHLCGKLGIPLTERPVAADELSLADEIFLTGTAAEVIAVTRVDGRAVGSGKPGAITTRLLAGFRELIRAECGGS